MKKYYATSNRNHITSTDYIEKPIVERKWRSTKDLIKPKDGFLKKILRRIK